MKQLTVLSVLVGAAFVLLMVLGWLVYLGKAPAETLVSDIQTGLGAIVGIIGAFHLGTFFRPTSGNPQSGESSK